MTIKIDEEKCTGCGICTNICPEGIEMVDGKARIKNENADCLKDTVTACPRRAIILDGGSFDNENINTNFNQNFGSGGDRGMGQGKGRGMGIGPRDGSGGGRGGGGRGQGGGRKNGKNK